MAMRTLTQSSAHMGTSLRPPAHSHHVSSIHLHVFSWPQSLFPAGALAQPLHPECHRISSCVLQGHRKHSQWLQMRLFFLRFIKQCVCTLRFAPSETMEAEGNPSPSCPDGGCDPLQGMTVTSSGNTEPSLLGILIMSH